jgi:membrane protein implicated in regulation of membrane protease activity
MDWLCSLFTDGAYSGWLLLALGALVVEILTGTMLFLSLSLALAVVAVLSAQFGLELGMLIYIGIGAWIGLSLLLKTVFGSWGSVKAVGDPNEYDRESAADSAQEADAEKKD